MADQSPLICRDIYKTFDQLEVLKGISLETRKGDVVVDEDEVEEDAVTA